MIDNPMINKPVIDNPTFNTTRPMITTTRKIDNPTTDKLMIDKTTVIDITFLPHKLVNLFAFCVEQLRAAFKPPVPDYQSR